MFSCFEASDTVYNLHVALDRFRGEVADMYNEVEVRKAYVLSTYFLYLNHFYMFTQRDYRFKVYLSGDYKFLSCMYGLSGASGKNI